MSTVTRAGLAAMLVLGAACQPAPPKASTVAAPAALSAADQAAIRAVDSAFAAAANAGDGAAVGALYASDATLMPPGDSSRHGANIATYWSGLFSAYSFPVSLHPVAVEGSGDMAIATGTYSVVMTPKAAGAKPMPVDNGKYLGVLKKQADGSWKYLYDTWNSDTPSAP
ncbi:MAG TPA: DUF4440 domain-containing protein [Gemmatimonadales bacterium]|nr:DUF4440 domain-containing protein [Gemmatimonadales bacterium]